MNARLLVGALATLALAPAALGQSSELFMFQYDGAQGNFHVFQNGASQRSWAGAGSGNGGQVREYGIAVVDDLRTIDYFGTSTGAQYDLNGTPSGTTYTHSLGINVIDGATDGVNHNYAGAYFGNAIYSFDRDWANPSLAFSVPSVSSITGITYDTGRGSLWVYAANSNSVVEYSTTGSVLGAFSVVNVGSEAMLAYEPSTQTIWLKPRNLQEIRQYSRDGNLLDTVALTGFGDNTLGMEFSVPTPGAAAFLGLAGLTLARRRRA